MAVTWSIWKLRNRILFANAEFDTNRIFEDAIFIVWTWLRQFEKDFTVHYNQWSSNIRQGFLFIVKNDNTRRGMPIKPAGRYLLTGRIAAF